MPRCSACSVLMWPPAEVCPECLASGFDWVEAPGGGVVWGAAEYHRGYSAGLSAEVPYQCVLVELECCDHCNGGTAAAVHRDFGAEVSKAYVSDGQCAGVPCTRRGCEDPTPVCRDGQCGLSVGGKVQMTPLPRQ